MCRVSKETYKPYVSAGETYYKTVLDVNPQITHSIMYGDEGGGFEIRVVFSKNESEFSLTKLYMAKQENNREYCFRATSTEPNIVGLSRKETDLLERSNEYVEFNRPVSVLLDELLEKGREVEGEINSINNEVSISFFSTDLNFWKAFLENYLNLKNKSYEEQLKWLSSQSNNESYFYIRRDISYEEMSTEALAKMLIGEEENVRESLTKSIFPLEVIKTFPVGSIYELELEGQQSRKLYESNEKNELVSSRYEYPVTY